MYILPEKMNNLKGLSRDVFGIIASFLKYDQEYLLCLRNTCVQFWKWIEKPQFSLLKGKAYPHFCRERPDLILEKNTMYPNFCIFFIDTYSGFISKDTIIRGGIKVFQHYADKYLWEITPKMIMDCLPNPTGFDDFSVYFKMDVARRREAFLLSIEYNDVWLLFLVKYNVVTSQIFADNLETFLRKQQPFWYGFDRIMPLFTFTNDQHYAIMDALVAVGYNERATDYVLKTGLCTRRVCNALENAGKIHKSIYSVCHCHVFPLIHNNKK